MEEGKTKVQSLELLRFGAGRKVAFLKPKVRVEHVRTNALGRLQSHLNAILQD